MCLNELEYRERKKLDNKLAECVMVRSLLIHFSKKNKSLIKYWNVIICNLYESLEMETVSLDRSLFQLPGLNNIITAYGKLH